MERESGRDESRVFSDCRWETDMQTRAATDGTVQNFALGRHRYCAEKERKTEIVVRES